MNRNSVCAQPQTQAAHFNVQLFVSVLSMTLTSKKNVLKKRLCTVRATMYYKINKIYNVKLYPPWKKMCPGIHKKAKDVYNHNILIY